jgi:hypothetical protein
MASAGISGFHLHLSPLTDQPVAGTATANPSQSQIDLLDPMPNQFAIECLA